MESTPTVPGSLTLISNEHNACVWLCDLSCVLVKVHLVAGTPHVLHTAYVC